MEDMKAYKKVQVEFNSLILQRLEMKNSENNGII